MAVALQAEQAWKEAFPSNKIRPKIYSGTIRDDHGFRPLADPTIFGEDISKLNSAQMYAVASNNALALQIAQREYLEISRELNEIRDIDKDVRDPQAPLDKFTFEETKEAELYGQPYEKGAPARLEHGRPNESFGKLPKGVDLLSDQERTDVRFAFDPFQIFYSKSKATDKPRRRGRDGLNDPANPDGFDPYRIDKKAYVPVQYQDEAEYTHKYNKRILDANGVPIRPVSPDPEEMDPSRHTQDNNSSQAAATSIEAGMQNRRATRYNGTKVPNTRDVSEAPSGTSTPKRKRNGTPLGAATREDTPNKRPKIEQSPLAPGSIHRPDSLSGAPRRKPHPNQYTKAREAREREAALTESASVEVAPAVVAPKLDLSNMTDDDKWKRKWTDAELLAAIKEDHTWLGVKADLWRPRLLNSANPVRSLSMLKKWRFWQDSGQDKRPRNREKSENGGKSKEGSVSRGRTPTTPATAVDSEAFIKPVTNGTHIEVNGIVHSEQRQEVGVEGDYFEQSDGINGGSRPALSRRSTRRGAY
jgi:hypothetical protein